MFFCVVDVDISVNHNIYGANLEYKKGVNGGWCVLEMPPEFVGVEDSLL